MDWGILTQFWQSITSITLEAGQYTAEFFKNIGYAVAGAIGGLFEWLIHYIHDFFLFFAWLLQIFKFLLSILIAPINYIFLFLRAFFQNAIKSPIVLENDLNNLTFSSSTMQVLQNIPFFNNLLYIIGIGLIVLGGVAILKLVLDI